MVSSKETRLSCLLLLLLFLSSAELSAGDDMTVLVSFKHSVERDPRNVLGNWNPSSNSSTVCSWTGVTCFDGRVVRIDLSGAGLVGRLQIDTLMPMENLKEVNLGGNSFSGNLSGGSATCNLESIDLSSNNFSEEIADSVFRYCSRLASFNLSRNSVPGGKFLIGPSLEQLDLSRNRLSDGRLLQYTLSRCQNLKLLNFSDNKFGGELEGISASSCESLSVLDLSYNLFSGNIPAGFISRLTMSNLKELYVPFNNITGSIPLSLSNCTNLELINLSSNELTGNIPTGLCSSLPSLRRLLLANNYLSGSVSLELGKCKKLQRVDLSLNELGGSIPLEVWWLPELHDLVLWANRLTGEIPESLCSHGGKLQTLILNNNLISGIIPPTLTSCLDLTWVSLSNNRLSGEMPSGFERLQSLAILQLGNNSITGEIPPALGKCKNLIWLDLNSNNLSGPVPAALADQAGLIVPGVVSGIQFAFVRNEAGTSCRGAGGLLEFEGIRTERLSTFPMVHSCPSTRIYSGTTVYTFAGNNGSMIYLDLSYNSLSGTIPDNYGSMYYLQVLNLGHNELAGPIPDSFGGLKEVGVLDLSHNNLDGFVPGALGGLTFLSDLDVSNNNLTGPIPSSGQLTTFPTSRYENNSGLCGVPLPACGSSARNRPDMNSKGRKQSMAGSVVIGIAVAMLFIFALSLALFKMRKNQKTEEQREQYVDSLPTSGSNSWKLSGVLEPLSINVATFEKPLRKLTFAHLLEATNGFSADSLIGSGGFGEVYKARLKDGCTVAIKKLVRVTGQGDREFTAEMETIGKIKHRNLVPLLGYCKIGEERLLVYEYMKWGSLETVLHDRKIKGGGTKLDWTARKKIAIGSARGLAFLHHSCIPHIIHRDMKSSNVLLDENLEARVSDFGMARLMNALDTHLSVSTLAGTPGYVPPEYYQSFRCTTKGDVYSYGVVLLELLSGKRPIDPNEFGDNNLVGWAKQLLREKRTGEIFDPELTGSMSGETELYQYLKIACECLDDRPLRRPTMIQVMAMFKELQMDSESDILDGFSLKDHVIDETREKEP
ncbi:hypothetical protein H6P81_008843 [Aristolochia fimbriata]|uniref:non-specific serine/threonine protein kinase n=1 Tax=Aristolochia fimbriata TaxID=158543 RepID=A0AAV7ENQ6_ARIFI|nr:hypothetical protein H6P81_008843 [Aristolochia fimbriata]